VLEVKPSQVLVYEGNSLNITVAVRNAGLNTESFNVTTYYNSTVMKVQALSSLSPGATTSFNCTWGTSGLTAGNYTIKARAEPVPNEYNITDNTLLYDGHVRIKIAGDVNSDDTVDVTDLAVLQIAYGSTPTSINWNQECDFNRDNIVNANDLEIFGKNYGKSI
jgi:hypothetical protein